MSRGPGRVQRALLAAVAAEQPVPVHQVVSEVYATETPTRAQRESVNRGARRLAALNVLRVERVRVREADWREREKTVLRRRWYLAECRAMLDTCKLCAEGMPRALATESQLAKLVDWHGDDSTRVRMARVSGVHQFQRDTEEPVARAVTERRFDSGWELCVLPPLADAERQQREADGARAMVQLRALFGRG